VPRLRQRGWALPDTDLTWHQVAAASNSEYHPDPDGPQWLHVDDDGKAYTVSTYNPESKWDWWVVGGRWPGHFTAAASARAEQLINAVPPQPTTTGEPGQHPDRLRCDGAPRHLLDFTAMRDEAAAAAHARYTGWDRIRARTPAARSRSQFSDLVTGGNSPSNRPASGTRNSRGSSPPARPASPAGTPARWRSSAPAATTTSPPHGAPGPTPTTTPRTDPPAVLAPGPTGLRFGGDQGPQPVASASTAAVIARLPRARATRSWRNTRHPSR
jgi:hypothetical protein